MSEKVTFQELIESIAEETNSTKQFTHDFLKDFVDVINSGLERDGNVNIAGLGKFELRHVDEREGYNPQTEERMTIPAHNRIVFKPYKDLRELVNAPYAHLEPELIKEEFKSSRKGEAEEKTASDEEDFIPTAPPTSHQAEESVESDQDTDQQEEPPFDLDEPETKTSPSFSFEEEDFEDAEEDEEDIVEFNAETAGDEEEIDDELSEFLETEETDTTSEATEEKIEESVDETEEASPFPADYQASKDQEDDEDEKGTPTPITTSFDNRRRSRTNSSSVPIIAAAVIILLLVAGGAWYLGLFSGDDAEQPISNQAVSTAQAPSATDNQGDQSSEQTQTTTEDNQEDEDQAQEAAQTDQTQQTAPAGQSQQADQPQQNDRESLELTIAEGQTLWSIADEKYRNSQLWPWIYDNNESLNNPNIIHAGNTLTIPLPSGPSQYGLSASDSVAVAKGYITTYRWYKDSGSSVAKNYLWVAKKYHEDLSDIAKVQIDQDDLAFANDAR